MALVEARAATAAAPAPSCRRPHAMEYRRHLYSGGSASAYYGGSPFGVGPDPTPQLDVFEYLYSSDEGVPAAVPAGNFGTPPQQQQQQMPVEHVVPDATSYGHAWSAAGEGARRTDRIAFRTRSEEEVLDDGYKWRKYGKKSVKNSPNPRNYYRCSTEGCDVKKRVERDRDDPSYVMTMYEGVHNHASPGTIYYATQDAASGRFFVAGMHHPGS